MYCYEDKHAEIETLLERGRKRWSLEAIAWMDYDDIKQIIRAHIAKKWHLWDQGKQFGPWCNRLIANQIKNQVRNHYSSFSKPCLRCPHNLGNESCAQTESGHQDSSCAQYKKWEVGKKAAYDVKMPIPLEDGFIDTTSHLYDEFDHDKSADNLHKEVLKRLDEKNGVIYTILFIKGGSDDEAALELSIRDGVSGNKAAYIKKVGLMKKKFYEVAREILQEEDIIE